uniref:Fibronectin type-III domain-containing protein n=1 Tax=Pundamilia nyererei TaxID=303518 RepID=A0A3B4FDU4_9CICH
LRLVQAGFFSLTLGWNQPSTPVQGYRITYGPQGRAHTYLFCFLPVLVIRSYPIMSEYLEVVQQLSVETESEGSVRVRWRGVSGARAYRLVWGPFTGRDVETVEVGGDINFYTLSGVQPDTEYIVTIIPLYEGNTEASPTTARFKIERQEQQVLRATYIYHERGPVQSLSFPRSTTNSVLTGLKPNTKYIFTLYTLFEGREEATPVSTTFREEQPVGRVSNLRVVEYLGSTVRLGWTGVAGATQYRVIILNTDCAEQSRTLGAELTAFTLEGLQPDEALIIGVAAVADQRVGEVATLATQTNPQSGLLSGLRVLDITPQRIRITWSLSSRATGYKITWRRDDGVETSRKVDASVSTYTIDGLQPDSAYTVQVSTLTGSREGTPAVLDVKTGISLDQPNTQNNRLVEVTQDSVRLGWSPLQGATGYILRWREESGKASWYRCSLFCFVSTSTCLHC